MRVSGGRWPRRRGIADAAWRPFARAGRCRRVRLPGECGSHRPREADGGARLRREEGFFRPRDAGRDQRDNRAQGAGARSCRWRHARAAEGRRPVRVRPWRRRGPGPCGGGHPVRGGAGRDERHRGAGICGHPGHASGRHVVGHVHNRSRGPDEERIGHRLAGACAAGAKGRHAVLLHGHAQPGAYREPPDGAGGCRRYAGCSRALGHDERAGDARGAHRGRCMPRARSWFCRAGYHPGRPRCQAAR